MPLLLFSGLKTSGNILWWLKQLPWKWSAHISDTERSFREECRLVFRCVCT